MEGWTCHSKAMVPSRTVIRQRQKRRVRCDRFRLEAAGPNLEPIALKAVRASAWYGVALAHADVKPVIRQQGSAAEPPDPTAHHHHVRLKIPLPLPSC
jgi:hypothetical protein